MQVIDCAHLDIQVYQFSPRYLVAATLYLAIARVSDTFQPKDQP